MKEGDPMTIRDVAAALARTKVELLAEVLRRCMGVAQDDNARQDFGDLNGGTLQRPTEVAAELLRALGDEGLTVAALASAPAAPGLDVGLIRAALNRWRDISRQGPGRWGLLPTPEWLAAEYARLAATEPDARSAPGLDVEALARALHKQHGHTDRHADFRGCGVCSPDAEWLAAEYARLAATDAAPPAEERTGSEPPYRWPNPSTLDGPQKTAAIHERLDARYCFIVDCDVPWHAAPPAEDRLAAALPTVEQLTVAIMAATGAPNRDDFGIAYRRSKGFSPYGLAVRVRAALADAEPRGAGE